MYQTLETVFHRLSKRLEFHPKYSAACRIFHSLLGVCISRWNTVSRVWFITSYKAKVNILGCIPYPLAKKGPILRLYLDLTLTIRKVIFMRQLIVHWPGAIKFLVKTVTDKSISASKLWEIQFIKCHYVSAEKERQNVIERNTWVQLFENTKKANVNIYYLEDTKKRHENCAWGWIA